MRLYLVDMVGKKHQVNFEASQTISELKSKCEDLTGHRYQLVFAGRTLEDDSTIGDNNIQTDAKIHCVLRLRGGMYHVSSGLQFQLTIMSARILTMNLTPAVFTTTTYRSDVDKLINKFLTEHHNMEQLKTDLLFLLFPETNDHNPKLIEIVTKFLQNVIKTC